MELSSSQKKYLRGLAHGEKAVILIGKKGLTPDLLSEINQALEVHELIKVKFNEHKDTRKEISKEIESASASAIVGEIGHTAISYKQHPEKKKRKILFKSVLD